MRHRILAPAIALALFLSAAAAPAAEAAPSLPASATSATSAAPPTPAARAASDPMADPSLATFHIRPVDDAWRARLPHDADAATQAYLDRLPPAVVARSNAYFEGGYWLQLWNWLMGLAIAAVLLGGRRSARLRAATGRLSRRVYVADALYTAAYMGLATLLSLPLEIYQGFVREHQYAMSTQAFGPWLGEQAIGAAINLALAAVLLPLLYRRIRTTGERWWMHATAWSMVVMTVLIMVFPVWIDPLFNTYKPVQDPAVRQAVLTMAQADGVPAKDVYQFDESRQSTRVSANVSGIFGTASVRLNDNLLRRCTLPEIRAVMGHELGHYVMNHVYKMLFEMAVLLFVAFAVIHWAMKRLLARHGERLGLSGLGDIAGLPLMIAVFSTFMLLATPVTNTLVRTQETEADRFGLNLSREPMGFAEAALKLTEYRKPDPGPVEEFVFFDHPSTRSRVHDAMRWREAMRSDGPGHPWPAATTSAVPSAAPPSTTTAAR